MNVYMYVYVSVYVFVLEAHVEHVELSLEFIL